MDSLCVHTNVDALEAVSHAGTSVLPLPSYSPDFNPIEQVWSKLKALVRAVRAHAMALDDAIAASLRSQPPTLGRGSHTVAMRPARP